MGYPDCTARQYIRDGLKLLKQKTGSLAVRKTATRPISATALLVFTFKPMQRAIEALRKHNPIFLLRERLRPNLRRETSENTRTDYLIENETGLTTLIHVSGLLNETVLLVFDDGSTTNVIEDSIFGTQVKGVLPMRPRRSQISGIEGRSVETNQGCAILPMMDGTDLTIAGHVVDYNITVSTIDLNEHLSLLKEEARLKGFNFDHVTVAKHEGKIGIIIGTLHDRYFPETIFTSFTGMHLKKSRVKTGKETPYCLSGRFPPLEEYRRGLAQLRLETDKCFITRNPAVQSALTWDGPATEPPDCATPAGPPLDDHYPAPRLSQSEIKQLLFQYNDRDTVLTPVKMNCITNITDDVITTRTKAFIPIKANLTVLTLDLFSTGSVQDFHAWKTKSKALIKERVLGSPDRIKTALLAIHGPARKALIREDVDYGNVDFDVFLDEIEEKFIKLSKSDEETEYIANKHINVVYDRILGNFTLPLFSRQNNNVLWASKYKDPMECGASDDEDNAAIDDELEQYDDFFELGMDDMCHNKNWTNRCLLTKTFCKSKPSTPLDKESTKIEYSKFDDPGYYKTLAMREENERKVDYYLWRAKLLEGRSKISDPFPNQYTKWWNEEDKERGLDKTPEEKPASTKSLVDQLRTEPTQPFFRPSGKQLQLERQAKRRAKADNKFLKTQGKESMSTTDKSGGKDDPKVPWATFRPYSEDPFPFKPPEVEHQFIPSSPSGSGGVKLKSYYDDAVSWSDDNLQTYPNTLPSITGVVKDMRKKHLPDPEKMDIISMMNWLDERLTSDMDNIIKCSNCPACNNNDKNLKLSLEKREENIILTENFWLDHKKKEARFRYAMRDGWETKLANNFQQAQANLQSLLKQCDRRGGNTWDLFKSQYNKFLEQGHMVKVSEIKNWDKLLAECPVKGGVFVPMTLAYKASLSTPLRPAADMARKGPKKYSINDMLYTGASNFNMNEFFIKGTLFPEFACSDFSKFYNSVRLEEEQYPLFQVLIPNEEGDLDPRTFIVAAMVKLWYGSDCAAFITQLAKERIVEHLDLPRDISTYVDDVCHSLPKKSVLVTMLQKYLDGFDQYKFHNKGMIVSREHPKGDQAMADENGFVKWAGLMYHAYRDIYYADFQTMHYKESKLKTILKYEDVFHGGTLDEMREYRKRTCPQMTVRIQMRSTLRYWAGNGGRCAPGLTLMKMVTRVANWLARDHIMKTGNTEKNAKYDFVLPEELVDMHVRAQHIMYEYSQMPFPRCNIAPGELLDEDNPKFVNVTHTDGSLEATMGTLHTYHPLKDGRWKANFGCTTHGLVKLKHNDEHGMIPQSQVRNELDGMHKGAIQAKSVFEMLKDRGATDNILLNDCLTAIYMVTSPSVKLDAYTYPRVAYIRQVFPPEKIMWIPGSRNLADVGTRPVTKAEEFGPQSDYWQGSDWMKLGLSIEEAIKQHYIVPSTELHKIKIAQDLAIDSPSNLTLKPGEQMTPKKFAVGQPISKFNVLTTKSGTDKVCLRLGPDGPLQLECSTSPSSSSWDWHEETGKPAGHITLDSAPALSLHTSTNTNQDVRPNASSALAINVLSKPLDEVVANTGALFRAITKFLGKIKGKKANEWKIVTDYSTSKSFLVDLVRPARHDDNYAKIFTDECEPFSTSPVQYRGMVEKDNYVTTNLKLKPPKTKDQATKMLFRNGWIKYPGCVKLIKLLRSLETNVTVNELPSITIEFTNAVLRIMGMSRQPKTHPRFSKFILFCKLSATLLMNALEKLSPDIRQSILSLKLDRDRRNVRENLGTNKTLLDTLREFWTEQAPALRINLEESIELGYYKVIPRFSAYYHRSHEAEAYLKMACKYLVLETQRAHEKDYPEHIRKKLGKAIEGVYISPRKLDQNVNLLQLLDPKGQKDWTELKWIDFQAVVPFILDKTALAIALVNWVHWMQRAPVYLLRKTRHRSLAMDIATCRAYCEIPNMHALFNRTREACPHCLKEKRNCIRRMYGLMHSDAELTPNYVPGDVIQMDLAGPFQIRTSSPTVGNPHPPFKKIWVLVAVCVVTYVTRVALMEGKRIAHFENAISTIAHYSHAPKKVIMDEESAAMATLKEDHEFFRVNSTLTKATKLKYELITVPVKDHRQGGMVERRIRQIKELLTGLKLEHMTTPITFMNRILLYAAALINNTVFCSRIKDAASNEIELLSSNSFLGKFKKGEATSPICIIDHDMDDFLKATESLYEQVNTLFRVTYFPTILKPRSGFWDDYEEINPGDVVAFDDGTGFKPELKFGTVISIEKDDATKGRNAILKLANTTLASGKKALSETYKLNISRSNRHLRGMKKLQSLGKSQNILDDLSLEIREVLKDHLIVADPKFKDDVLEPAPGHAPEDDSSLPGLQVSSLPLDFIDDSLNPTPTDENSETPPGEEELVSVDPTTLPETHPSLNGRDREVLDNISNILSSELASDPQDIEDSAQDQMDPLNFSLTRPGGPKFRELGISRPCQPVVTELELPLAVRACGPASLRHDTPTTESSNSIYMPEEVQLDHSTGSEVNIKARLPAVSVSDLLETPAPPAASTSETATVESLSSPDYVTQPAGQHDTVCHETRYTLKRVSVKLNDLSSEMKEQLRSLGHVKIDSTGTVQQNRLRQTAARLRSLSPEIKDDLRSSSKTKTPPQSPIKTVTVELRSLSPQIKDDLRLKGMTKTPPQSPTKRLEVRLDKISPEILSKAGVISPTKATKEETRLEKLQRMNLVPRQSNPTAASKVSKPSQVETRQDKLRRLNLLPNTRELRPRRQILLIGSKPRSIDIKSQTQVPDVSVVDNGSIGSRSGSRLHRLLAGSRLHHLLARVSNSSSKGSISRPSSFLAWTRSQLRRMYRRQEKKRTTSTPLLNSQTDLIGTEKEGTITVTTVNPNFRLTARLAEDQPLQRAYEVN